MIALIVHSDLSDDRTVCLEVLSSFFGHPSIDATKKMRLHPFGWMMFQCFASIKPLSASRRSFQWMLLSKSLEWPWIEWHSRRITETSQKKLIWTAASSTNSFKILAGIIENYPYGNVCLCRIIMNACSNYKNNNFISVPYIDLHFTKK